MLQLVFPGRRQTNFGSTPHQCKICHRFYTTKTSLRRHEAQHEGKFPYTCPICGKGSTNTSYIRDHIAKHYIAKHGEDGKQGKEADTGSLGTVKEGVEQQADPVSPGTTCMKEGAEQADPVSPLNATMKESGEQTDPGSPGL